MMCNADSLFCKKISHIAAPKSGSEADNDNTCLVFHVAVAFVPATAPDY